MVHDTLCHMTCVIYVILWHTMTNVMRHRMSQTIAIWVSNEPSWLVQLIYGIQNHFWFSFLDKIQNKLGLSWAKLSLSWGLKLEFEVEVELQIVIVAWSLSLKRKFKVEVWGWCLKLKYWSLKYSKIIPLHKKESALERHNYRPIAILSPLSKILEKIAFKQIYDHFSKKSYLIKIFMATE